MTLTRIEVDRLADAAAIAALDLSFDCIDDAAGALLGYQRTKQISRASRTSWEAGDARPLLAEFRARRAEIVQGAALEIYREYIPLRRAIEGREIRSVCDVGCGQGINNLFVYRDFGPSFTLVDIEETDEQYHLWREAGAGYASLDAARALLVDNGVAGAAVETVNPRHRAWAQGGRGFDLVTSLYSCGFHYPIDDYLELFVDTLETGGAVCLDLRGHYLETGSPALSRLAEAGVPELVFEDTKSSRMLFRRAGGVLRSG